MFFLQLPLTRLWIRYWWDFVYFIYSFMSPVHYPLLKKKDEINDKDKNKIIKIKITRQQNRESSDH